MKINFGGRMVNLKGKGVEVGQKAPDFKVLAQDLSEKKLSDFKEDFIVLSLAPSIDTSVCSHQTKQFYQKLAEHRNTRLIALTNDLPFAQKRWCEGEGVDSATLLSDYRDLDFALNYGVLIEELRLLARGVFILDQARNIVYKEILKDAGNLPDFDAALNALKELS